MTNPPPCRGVDTEIFYNADTYAQAAVICASCPVVEQCRRDTANDPHGYSGGMTPQQRTRWAIDQGITPAPAPATTVRSSPRTITDQQWEQVAELWHQDMGSRRIADATGIHRSSIERYCRDHGLVRTPEERNRLSREAGNRVATARQSTDKHRMVFKLLAENTYTPREIADLVGCTVGHVYKLRRKTP